MFAVHARAPFFAAVVAFLAFEEGRWTTAPAIEASGG